jgi:hypothetical protein
MGERYVELILQWRAGTDAAMVRDWLKQRDIGFMEMRSGLLIFGDTKTLDRHLSVSLDNITPPAEIPVPSQLQPDVTSILLPRPRRHHA